MAKLTFYRQKRYDGAIRTGVELDGETVAENYEQQSDVHDPALLWYVDLRCEGSGVPDDPNLAAHWLLGNAAVIRDGFIGFADKLRAGADPDIYSLTWSSFSNPESVSLMIACSAIRRIDAREMSSLLLDIGARWEEIVKSLDVPQEVEDLR